ncbi:MAG: hypothetical protein F6K20_36415, partial [Moorea sp. SIO2C4]|nr:hypothetical protein [Moorena sp. SIO2C4]
IEYYSVRKQTVKPSPSAPCYFCSLLPAPCSLLPAPDSRFPIPDSLLPTPYSLRSGNDTRMTEVLSV